MEKFKISLLAQQSSLQRHITNLELYMRRNSANIMIAQSEWDLLHQQLDTMRSLNSILLKRLALHNLIDFSET